MRKWVNLLVGMLVIVVAGGLLVTGIFKTREAAARMSCSNNLRLIGMALGNYHDSWGRFPPAAVPNPDLPPEKRLSWLAAIMPYMESNSLWAKLDKKKPWDAEENRFAALTVFRAYQCPSYPSREPVSTLAPTHYLGIAGIGPEAALLPPDDPRAGFFGYERKLRLEDIKDSPDTTLLAVETSAADGSWTAGGSATVRGLDPSKPPYLGAEAQFGGNHKGGANAVFADASARFLHDSLDARVFEALATTAGGEQVGPLDAD